MPHPSLVARAALESAGRSTIVIGRKCRGLVRGRQVPIEQRARDAIVPRLLQPQWRNLADVVMQTIAENATEHLQTSQTRQSPAVASTSLPPSVCDPL